MEKKDTNRAEIIRKVITEKPWLTNMHIAQLTGQDSQYVASVRWAMKHAARSRENRKKLREERRAKEPQKSDLIKAFYKKHPGTSSLVAADLLKCDPGYVRAVRRSIEAESENAESENGALSRAQIRQAITTHYGDHAAARKAGQRAADVARACGLDPLTIKAEYDRAYNKTMRATGKERHEYAQPLNQGQALKRDFNERLTDD